MLQAVMANFSKKKNSRSRGFLMKIPGKKKPTSLHTQKSLLNFFPKIKQEMMKK
jgi:hypothetical protein